MLSITLAKLATATNNLHHSNARRVRGGAKQTSKTCESTLRVSTRLHTDLIMIVAQCAIAECEPPTFPRTELVSALLVQEPL
jgi:hypothetical protein